MVALQADICRCSFNSKLDNLGISISFSTAYERCLHPAKKRLRIFDIGFPFAGKKLSHYKIQWSYEL